MFCSNCSKLAVLYNKRTCIKCQSEVFNNISVLCENCSNSEKKCSICLRKVDIFSVSKNRARGCNCGGK